MSRYAHLCYIKVPGLEMFGASPTTIIQVGNEDCKAIVDTGSTANFISAEMFDRLEANTYRLFTLKHRINVYNANQTKMDVDSYVALECIIESEPVIIHAFVADWLQVDCILGVPFKEEFKDIAMPIINRKVKLVTIDDQIKMISALKARRLLTKKTTEAHLFWVSAGGTIRKDVSSELTQQLLKKFGKVIVDELPNLPTPNRIIKHHIELLPGSSPVARRAYRMSFSERKELERQLQELLAAGRIEVGNSPFAAPVLFVIKKDGSKRLCCDFRGLNEVTVKSKFPLPRIDDLFDMLSGASVFSQLDLVIGYHQVEVEPKDQYKTAFVTHEGQYIWKVMPFGLTNAPSTFQRLMNETLKGYIGKFVIVYLDDILIFSKDQKEHTMHLGLMLNRLQKAQLYAKKSKCHFYLDKVHFLGHTIDKDGIHVDDKKVKAMVDWPKPQKPKDAASFLGLAGFYRKFVEDFSGIANPLYEYSNKKRSWDDDCDRAFQTLKSKLTSAPVLLPFDESKGIVVTTDASDYAVGATLELVNDQGNVEGVVAYMSAKLHGAQLNWPVREKEGYAIRLALEHWSHYLKGKHFVLHTDHESLKFLHSKKDTSPKIARWLDTFAEYDFEIVYIPGEHNRADGLSRRPDLKNTTCSDTVEMAKTIDAKLWTLQTSNVITTFNAITPELLDTIKQGYETDNDFKIIYEVLSKKIETPPEFRTIIKRYEIKDGLLYYGFTSRTKNKLCIPDNEIRGQILKLAHDSPASAHCDALRTFLNISPFYHWPRMQKTIINYVKTCELCQKSKSKTGRPFGTYHPLEVSDDRWRDINIDFLSGMEPDITSVNDSIMVVIDRLSKMSHMIGLKKTTTTEELCNIFMREIFRLHGAPRSIVSDRDKLFTSAVWDRFAQRLGIHLNFTTSNNPQGDGQVERLNRTISERIRTLCEQYPQSWNELLPMLEFGYNNSYQSTIRATPFLAAYAFHPRFVGLLNPIQPSVRDPLGHEQETGRSFKAQLDRILQRSEAIREDIIRSIAAEQERISIERNKKMIPAHFKVGDKVLIHNSAYMKPTKGQKFQFLWYGPFEIVEQVSTSSYRIAIRKGKTKHDVFPAKSLKPFNERQNDYGRVPPVNDEDIRARINEICGFGDMQQRGNETLVEAKWKDCEDWDSTIIPLEWVKEKVPEDYLLYLKQHRNRRQSLQSAAIQERREMLMSRPNGRNRTGRPRVNAKKIGKRRGNNRF